MDESCTCGSISLKLRSLKSCTMSSDPKATTEPSSCFSIAVLGLVYVDIQFPSPFQRGINLCYSKLIFACGKGAADSGMRAACEQSNNYDLN